MKANWIAANEATDEHGFYLNSDTHGTKAFDAERAALAEMGAPDTEAIEFDYVLAIDRDTAEVLATVTPALYEWLLNEEMIYGEEIPQP